MRSSPLLHISALLLLLTVEAFQPLNFATPFNRNSLDPHKSNPTQQTSKSNPLQATQQSISSTASTTSTTSNPSNLGCWLPVASVSGIEDLLPMNVKIANIDCVVWKDSNENWAVQKDECAHRLVPLSQGRISEDGGGRIECPYHGWQFNSEMRGAKRRALRTFYYTNSSLRSSRLRQPPGSFNTSRRPHRLRLRFVSPTTRL